MAKPIRFSRHAREEVLEAGRWYERQRRGLRAEFLASLDERVKRVHLERFPFSLIFIELPDRIRILAVAHNRRKPFYWRDRVDD